MQRRLILHRDTPTCTHTCTHHAEKSKDNEVWRTVKNEKILSLLSLCSDSRRKHPLVTHLFVHTKPRRINTTGNTDNHTPASSVLSDREVYRSTGASVRSSQARLPGPLSSSLLSSLLHSFSPSTPFHHHLNHLLWKGGLFIVPDKHVWVWLPVSSPSDVLIVRLHIQVHLAPCPWPKGITVLIIED